MDPRAGRFVSTDSFAGHAFEPVTLHKYLYANANPVSNTDPTGHFAEELAIGLAIAAIVFSIACIGMAVYNHSLSDVPITVNTQPVILKESSWTRAAAESVLVAASAIWFNVARINVTWNQPIVADTVDPKLLDVKGDIPPASFPSEWGNHMTIFNRSVDSGEAGGIGAPLVGGSRAAAIVSTESGFVLAHEWGHTLKLKHAFLTPNLMAFPVELGAEVLGPDQRQTARDSAMTSPWWRP